MIKAHAVPVPSDSVLAPLYVGADLLDAFAIHLPAGASDDLEVLARALFERQAGWIRALTWVRDAVMATVGVKSSRAIGAAAAARGPVIGYFPLLSKSAGELVVGEDDRHLDFRVAILLRTGAAGGRELVVVTVVHCHNRLGRTYLAVIAPFHRAPARVIVKTPQFFRSSDGSHRQGHDLAPSGLRIVRVLVAIYGSQHRKHSGPCSQIRHKRATRFPRDGNDSSSVERHRVRAGQQ